MRNLGYLVRSQFRLRSWLAVSFFMESPIESARTRAERACSRVYDALWGLHSPPRRRRERPYLLTRTRALVLQNIVRRLRAPKFKTSRFALGPKNVHQPWPLGLILQAPGDVPR